MRRKRFQRGCLKTRKRNGKNYWYAQWREDGKPKSKEIGLCSKMDRVKAEGILTEILKPINEGAENPEKITWTFAKFCEVVYLPVCHRKWKASTDMVEANRLEVHLVRPLAAGNVDLRFREGNADEAGQYLAEVHVPEAQAGWSGVGDIPGHAADFRDLVEGGWGGCPYPVGTDGQHG